MSFDLAERAAEIALQSLARGTPMAEAFTRVRKAVMPSLPKSAGDAVAELDIGADIDALREQLAHVLATEPPGDQINGLCFGLAEMVFGPEDGSPPDAKQHPEHTLYICGSARFDPEDSDWPCDPEWWPESRYFDIPSFRTLSDVSATLDDDAAWLVACGLIEPLSILLVGEACRTMDRRTLLGASEWRGIGSGFDGGDLRDIGVVTRDGFASPALVEATPVPARRATKAKRSTPKAKKSNTAKAKPPKGKASRSKGSTPKKSAAKKTGGKKAVKKKAGTKRVGKKQGAKRTASKKAPSKTGKKSARR